MTRPDLHHNVGPIIVKAGEPHRDYLPGRGARCRDLRRSSRLRRLVSPTLTPSQPYNMMNRQDGLSAGKQSECVRDIFPE